MRDPTIVIAVIEDEFYVRTWLKSILEAHYVVKSYSDAEAFLSDSEFGRASCLLIDVDLPGQSGLHLLKDLRAAGNHVPAIILTGLRPGEDTVTAMRAGARDFLSKPIDERELLAAIEAATKVERLPSQRHIRHLKAVEQLKALTPRQLQIMELILDGRSSKVIAHDLKISQRTVEAHRALLMKKLGVTSLAQLIRVACFAEME